MPEPDADVREGLSEELANASQVAKLARRVPLAERLAASLRRASGATARRFTGRGSSAREAALLQGLRVGDIDTLWDRIKQLDEDGIEYALAGGPSAGDASLLQEVFTQAVFAQSGVGVGISDVTGRILVVNAAFAKMFGYDDVHEFAATVKITDMTHPDDPPGVWEQYRQLMTGEVDRVSLEKPHIHRDGHTLWNSINVSLIHDRDGAPAYTLALFEDVTERHLLQDRMRHQALHDALTGLPNRAQFFDRLTEAFQDPHSRVGVCYIDLDGFKAINDTLGHDAGDKLLIEVADRLRSCLRRPGQLAARLGGDEFIVLVPQPEGTAEVVELAEAIMRALALPIDIDGHPIVVSASVGVMEEQVANTSAVDLMKGADVSLVWAKESGRKRWVVYDAEREKTRYCLSPGAMRAALDRGEFSLVYHPIVRLTDNLMIGAEALLRWDHPTLGTVLPGRFIDLAEDNGLMVPLTAYVIEQACREARDWPRSSFGRQPFVSVNVSASNIHDPGFLPMVERVLAETGLPAYALQLEVTENASLTRFEESAAKLQEVSALGVGIAIDDFGTGFCSLDYLRSLPFHAVKFAGEIIENIDDKLHGRPADEQIARAMIDLVHTLGLTVTAEQVETSGQAARLRALGCDAAQGWYFAKPLPPDEIGAALLANSSMTN
jgi:diguanylate cyclase (GGDEF)-like protein/PAS domain S-box-containing protein